MPEKETLSEHQEIRINAELGCELFIQVQGLKERLSSYLAGIIPETYLIMKTPQLVDVREVLADGTPVVLRYVHWGQVYGFRSIVVRSIISPSKLTFLTYPDNIEKINLRKTPRVSCYIPASINYKGAKTNGVITNISRNGIKFTTRSLEELEANQIPILEDIKISFSVLGIEGIQDFQGKVRNRNHDSKKISLGIEFLQINENIVSLIDDYIKEVKEYEEP